MPPSNSRKQEIGGQLSYADAFGIALLDAERAIPRGVIGPGGKAAAKRYNVYRNNATVSLIDALAASFPEIQRITGMDFFRAMARFHIRARAAKHSLADLHAPFADAGLWGRMRTEPA